MIIYPRDLKAVSVCDGDISKLSLCCRMVFTHMSTWIAEKDSMIRSCVKSVRIRRFSGLYFPLFGLKTKKYSVFSANTEKYGQEKLQIQTPFTQWLLPTST